MLIFVKFLGAGLAVGLSTYFMFNSRYEQNRKFSVEKKMGNGL